jgi:hypothetical protein
VVPIRGTWEDFNEDTPSLDIAVYHTEGDMDQYAPVQPRLLSVLDTLLEARHPPTLLLRDIVSPSSGIREIRQTMLEKFREARVADCVQHYARWDLGQENTSVPVAVREEAVLSCIVSLLRAEKICALRSGSFARRWTRWMNVSFRAYNVRVKRKSVATCWRALTRYSRLMLI